MLFKKFSYTSLVENKVRSTSKLKSLDDWDILYIKNCLDNNCLLIQQDHQQLILTEIYERVCIETKWPTIESFLYLSH